MNLIWFFIILLVLILLTFAFDIKETFLPEYLSHKTKSFDAENEARIMYGDAGAWLGQPSKLYSAESQGVAQYGLEGGFIGKTLKYY